MAFSIRGGMTFTTPAGTVSSVTGTYSVDALAEYDIEVPANQTDYAVEMSFPYANIKAVLFSSTAACTIETNSGSAADDTIALTSAVLAKAWFHDGIAGNLAANPLSANVTALYITNTTACTVKVRVGYDATP